MATYWAILGKIWATFYSNISSQCLRLSDLFTFDCIEKTKFKTKRSEMAKRCLKSSHSIFKDAQNISAMCKIIWATFVRKFVIETFQK